MKKLDNTEFNYHDEDEIDIKEVFSVLLHYKKSILFIALMGIFIALPRAYFALPTYQAETLLQISMEDPKNYIQNIINTATPTDINDIEDELIVFRSTNIAKKTLETLHIGTRYFKTKNFKTEELYKNSPFIVTYQSVSPEIFGTMFTVIPIDKDKFKLLIETPLKTKIMNYVDSFFISNDESEAPIVYNKIHSFSKPINTEWFSISVEKIYPFKNETYSFSITPNESMVGFVQGGIAASAMSKYGSMVSLTFNDNVGLRAKEIVNRVANAYIDENLKLVTESAEKQLQFLDMQIEAIHKTVEGSATKLQSYKATNIVVDLSNKARITARKLSEFERELYELNIEINIMENMTQQIKVQKEIGSITIDYSQRVNPAILRLLSEIQRVTSQYATLSVKHTAFHPEIIMAKKHLSSLKTSLAEAIEGNLDSLKKRQLFLLKAIEKKKNILKSFPKQEQQLEELTRDFMVNEKVYSYLLNKRAEISLLKASAVSNSRIIEKAHVPGGAVKPKPALIILVALILGFILGIAQAFLRNFLDNDIKTIDDIQKLTHITLYGAIPLANSEKTIQYYDEAMRTLWINLEFFKIKTPNFAKLIALTSSVAGEGKTFTAFNLAETIAKNSDKKVIILDLDMRRPTLHEKFKIPNSASGMSTLLTEKYTLLEAIQGTKYDNLQVITSGPRSPNPTGLIMSVVLESIIKELSTKYDYILLDTPPIGIVSDATKIMHMADLTLVLLKANYSKKEFIKEINYLQENEHIDLGIILNGMDFQKNYGYGYNSKYMNEYYGTK